MKAHTLLRAVGVVGIVGAYAIFALDGGNVQALIVAVVGIIALISPEVLDKLPFGPSKS
jgi:hypothetical protein